MPESFFDRPILTSPYEYPTRHWELDAAGQPTERIVESRRRAEFITPIPGPKKRRRGQKALVYDEGRGLSTEAQQYEATSTIINELRARVDRWRELPNPNDWLVTAETARLLEHWRHHRFQSIRPFFCQVEAVETAIWLTEVAPKLGKEGRRFLDHLAAANEQANPGLARLALKLATGAGKTTVMAMLIAWQTINSVRRPTAKRFTRGFLVVTPGLTIRDRLRVLQPHDPDSYYRSRELVLDDMRRDLERARIVITNYHAFKLRETMAISKGGRPLLQGRGPEIQTLETEGQMLQRVCPELMGMKSILAINDEAHHCYREKPGEADEGQLKGEDRKEAEKNREAARLWISGLEAVQRRLGLQRVFDREALDPSAGEHNSAPSGSPSRTSAAAVLAFAPVSAGTRQAVNTPSTIEFLAICRLQWRSINDKELRRAEEAAAGARAHYQFVQVRGRATQSRRADVPSTIHRRRRAPRRDRVTAADNAQDGETEGG